MSDKNYWCYRIDKNKISFFSKELNNNRLRQGWGWDEKQNLLNLQMDEGAKRNLSMLRVKKGDILLVPRLPSWGYVALVEATEDWDKGYRFEIDINLKDYGHIFPAKIIGHFSRRNENVTGNLRSTLKNPSRFWSINHLADDVEFLIGVKDDNLTLKIDHESRFEDAIGEVFASTFDEEVFSSNLYEKMNKQFTQEEWEFALTAGLKKLFPYYKIERVGGKTEKNHGTDILIKMPSLLQDYEYAIAIQVKDYTGAVGKEVISQINKADSYWSDENLKLIEKWLVITRASKEANKNLEGLSRQEGNIKIIFASELKTLLSWIAKTVINLD